MKHKTFFLSNTSATLGNTSFRLHASSLTFILLLALGLIGITAQAQTYTEQTLHSFGSSSTDGIYPYASLIAVNGILYGTTQEGGTASFSGGTVFAVNPDGTGYQTLHSFASVPNDGYGPAAGLINVNGILYGTTVGGGKNSGGTVFAVNPDGSGYQISYNLKAATGDGQSPEAALININGTLYGTTNQGGANGEGCVYAVNPDGTGYQTVYSLGATSSDGYNPEAALINVNGKLYGTTIGGDTYNDGTVFAVNPDGSGYQILHSFGTTSSDGFDPEAGLTAVNGKLYGTTVNGGTNGGGNVFAINADGTGYQIIYSFGGTTGDGKYPEAGLIAVNGKLYGTTNGGGTYNDGSVYAVNPDGSGYHTLYSFGADADDGHYPDAALINVNGTFYGTTDQSGANGYGTVFSLTPVIVPPTAYNDACTIKYNTARTNAAPGVLANDNAGYSTTLTAALVTTTTHGSLTLGSDGSFTYTPNTGYVGTDSFTYQDVNSAGHSNTATCTFTVQAVTPIAHNDACSIAYNKARTNAAPGVLANDFTGGSTPLTATLVSGTTHGSITLNSDGSFTYTPNTGYAGTDTFTYQVSNAVGQGTIGTVTLTVIATTPTAKNDACTIAHNKARTNAAPGVLGNDDNGGSGPLTATLVTNVKHGTLSLGSDGSFTYTPNMGYSGTDTFTYQAVNSVGKSNIATCTLTVQ